jgi:serine/threonine protein kinase
MLVTKMEFLDILRKSKVLNAEKLQQLAEGTESDAMRLAQRLVREKFLTEWQARYLMSGKHQLEIGPYRLLERIQRDDLGDRFLAIHAQLERNVDLQMISSAHSKDESRYQAFIERVGQVSQLDHPNLVHVFDVDKAWGRYYLVTEHVEGCPLTDFKEGSFGLTTALHWFRQAAAGLRHAHSMRIGHGDLRSEDLMINKEHGLKIRNLAITVLRAPSSASLGSFAPLEDWKTLGLVFRQLIGQSADRSAWTTQTAECQRWLDELTQVKDVREVDLIEDQISTLCEQLPRESADNAWRLQLDKLNDLEVDSHEEAHRADYAAKTQMTSQRTGNPASIPAKAKPRSLADEGYWGQSQETSRERWFDRLASGNPVGLLSSAFVLGLLTFGMLTYLALSTYSPRSVAQVEQPANADDLAKTKTLVSTTVRKDSDGSAPSEEAAASPSKEGASTDPKEGASPTLDPSVAKKVGQTEIPGSLPTDKAGVAPTTEGNLASAQSSPPANPTGVPAASAIPASSAPALGSDNVVFPSAKEMASAPTDVSIPLAQPAVVANNNTNPAVTAALSTDAEAELAKKLEQPFAQLPKHLSIPAIADTVEVKLGEVFIADRFLMGAELVVFEGIANSKTFFETERDATNDQRWLINLSRTSKDKKTPVAALRRDGRDVFFQWLPEARSNRNAGYLQNCLLKLFVPDQSVLLALRAPVEIAPLVLKPGTLTAETNFELDYLPKSERLLVEVLPVTIAETRLSPSVIDLAGGIPGRVLLKGKDDNALVWVNLALELKAKARLRADLVVIEGNRARSLKDLNELKTVAQRWKNQELALTHQVQTAQATQAPYGKAVEKQNFISALNKQKDFAIDSATKYQQYVELAPKMMEQPYGIRVVARFEGFELELARSRLESSSPSPANQ